MSITRQPLGEFPADRRLQPVLPPARARTWRSSRVDEYKAPVLSSWQAGLGRVLCYTGEADGKYTGPIAGWTDAGDFFTSLARWTAGKSQGLGKDVVATQELRSGVCRVELHLDPEREATPVRPPAGTHHALGPARRGRPCPRRLAMNWSSADTLLAEIPIAGSETILTTVDGAGHGPGHARPDVPALLARVSAAEAGAGNRGAGATGQVRPAAASG